VNKQVAFSSIILELHVPDFKVAIAFYSKLGFEIAWQRPPKGRSGYLVMRKGDSVLAFFCGNEEVYNHPFFKRYPKNTPKGFGVEICLYLSDELIDDYYKHVIKSLGKECVVEELKMKPWRSKDFRIIDPFGYYICVREPNNILEP